MSYVASYNGYNIVDSGVGYLLIIKAGGWDYVQEPFNDISAAKRRIDKLNQ